METSHTIDVIALDAVHRQAIEEVIGARLEEDQRIVIHVTIAESSHTPQSLADWTGVYEGLTEGQIEAIDRDVNSRANLTRNMP